MRKTPLCTPATEPQKGKWKRPRKYGSHKDAAIEMRGITVYQYDVETLEKIGAYQTVTDAAGDNGLSYSTISNALKRNNGMYADGFSIYSTTDYGDEIEYKDYLDEPIERVNHPKHYNKGIEAWDYIVSHEMGFLEGNIIKYITRYKSKNGIEDLKKAQQYLKKLVEIETIKLEEEV